MDCEETVIDWIPVTERMPVCDEYAEYDVYLCTVAEGEDRPYVKFVYFDGKDFWKDVNFINGYWCGTGKLTKQVTAWCDPRPYKVEEYDEKIRRKYGTK